MWFYGQPVRKYVLLISFLISDKNNIYPYKHYVLLMGHGQTNARGVKYAQWVQRRMVLVVDF